MGTTIFENWSRQIRALLPVWLRVYPLVLILLGGLTLFALISGQRVWFFTADPFIIGNLPFYAGILSNLGFLFWGGTAAVCFFGAWLLRGWENTAAWRRFLTASGIYTLLFLLDDLMQLHRIFFPEEANGLIGMVYLAFGLLGLAYFLFFRSQILETEYLMLASAVSFLLAAVVVDVFSLFPRGNTALSDFLKFFGVVSWFIYYFRTTRDVIRGARNEERGTRIKDRGARSEERGTRIKGK
jgi:hypothetical protein